MSNLIHNAQQNGSRKVLVHAAKDEDCASEGINRIAAMHRKAVFGFGIGQPFCAGFRSIETFNASTRHCPHPIFEVSPIEIRADEFSHLQSL